MFMFLERETQPFILQNLKKNFSKILLLYTFYFLVVFVHTIYV